MGRLTIPNAIVSRRKAVLAGNAINDAVEHPLIERPTSRPNPGTITIAGARRRGGARRRVARILRGSALRAIPVTWHVDDRTALARRTRRVRHTSLIDALRADRGA